MKRVLAALMTGCTLCAAQGLEIHSLDARHAPGAPNSFSLNFGDGVDRISQITDTTYDLRLNETAGAAQFVSYEQFVAPIEIPIGPGQVLSTGDLTIRVLPGTSSGTYDVASGQFSTQESYEISFTGDLSMIGFFSPVILPSQSSGQVTYASDNTGSVEQIWEGAVDMGPIQLTYVCRVNTTFAQRLVGDLNCDSQLTANDIGHFVQALTRPADYIASHPGCDIDLADVNGDGVTSVGDIALFIQTLTN